MVRDKYRDALICTSAILTGLVGALMFLPVAIVRANPGPDSAASSATFRTKCVTCHGQDGSGSAAGKNERFGSSLAGSAKITRCGTCAGDFQWPGRKALLQGFA